MEQSFGSVNPGEMFYTAPTQSLSKTQRRRRQRLNQKRRALAAAGYTQPLYVILSEEDARQKREAKKSEKRRKRRLRAHKAMENVMPARFVVFAQEPKMYRTEEFQAEAQAETQAALQAEGSNENDDWAAHINMQFSTDQASCMTTAYYDRSDNYLAEGFLCQQACWSAYFSNSQYSSANTLSVTDCGHSLALTEKWNYNLLNNFCCNETAYYTQTNRYTQYNNNFYEERGQIQQFCQYGNAAQYCGSYWEMHGQGMFWQLEEIQ